MKVGMIGRGRLGSIIMEAINKGLAPDCELVGVASRSLGVSVDDLIARGAEVIIEAAKPEVLRKELLKMLEAGVSVIPLSTGALADPAFLEEVKDCARKHHAKVYLPHGAEGGFDLAATYALLPGMKGTVVQYIPARTPETMNNPMAKLPEHFHGPVLEGFALSPAHLNVTIASAIACGGFAHTYYETRVPEDGKSAWVLELENDGAKAVLRMESKPQTEYSLFHMIALSAVSTLNRITSPITF